MTDIATSPLTLALALRFSIRPLSFTALWRNVWRMSAVAVAITALHAAMEFYMPASSAGLLSVGAALLMFAVVTAPDTVAAVQHVRGGRPKLSGMLCAEKEGIGIDDIAKVFD